MRNFVFIIFLLLSSGLEGQDLNWQNAKEWKLYKLKGDSGLRLPIDSIVNYPFLLIDMDTLNSYLKQISIWPKGKRSVWMGAYYASCILEGALHKIDISVYGGFIYDENSRRFYQLPDFLRNDWMAWLGSMKARVNEIQ